MASASALLSSVLPTPVGPRNRKEPTGRLGSLSPTLPRRMALGNGCHRVVLTDDALVQDILHVQQPFALRLGQLVDGGFPSTRK